MDKIKKYVERFFKGGRCNPRYEMKYGEVTDVMASIISSRDANQSLPIICTLFNYGYAKGYRAAQAEMKKKARETA